MCFARAEAVAAEADIDEAAEGGTEEEEDEIEEEDAGVLRAGVRTGLGPGSASLALLALVLLPGGSSKGAVLPPDAAAATLDGGLGSLSAAAGPITGSRCAATSLMNSAKWGTKAASFRPC
jgi:hypothetical protein